MNILKNKKIMLYRAVLIVAAFLFVVFLISKDLSLSGKLDFKTNFKKFTPFISILVPQERVKNFDFVYINQEPVYFDVFMPRDFDKAVLHFEYQNNFENLIEVGAHAGSNAWDLKPLDNRIINELGWPRLTDNHLTLFQRRQEYQSVNEFLDNLPDLSAIAAYNHKLDYDYEIPDYQASDDFTILNNKILGGYQFYTYLADNEDLFFEFELSRLITEYDDEYLAVNVYDFNNQHLESFFPVDDEYRIKAQMEKIPAGVYKIEVFADSITETRQIKTKQQYLSFIDNLNLISPAELYSESKNFIFITYDNNGLQTVKIGEEKLAVADAWEQYQANQESGMKKIIIPRGNINITTPGLVAFSEKQYFNPLLKRLDFNADLDGDKIDYIIADYQLPEIKDGFKINSVEFDLFDKQIINGKLRFVISVPGLSSSAQGPFIKNLRVELLRKSVWREGLFGNLKNYLKYYRDEIKK